MKYVNSLLKGDCSSDLMPLFTHCNNPVKEITESIAAFKHMSKALSEHDIEFKDTFNLHIGDGSTCRTGVLFSFMSPSVNVSIDPNINEKIMLKWAEQYQPQRFYYSKSKYEDKTTWNTVRQAFEKEFYGKQNPSSVLNVVLVHSHVSTSEVLTCCKNWLFCYVNPCCEKNKQLLTLKQIEDNDIDVVMAATDLNIMSPEDYVIVYKNNKVVK